MRAAAGASRSRPPIASPAMSSELQRRALPIAIATCVAVLGIGAGGASAVQPEPGCASFGTQAAAQLNLMQGGGSSRRTTAGLDADRDGVACEGLPGPYKGFATIGYNLKQRFFYGSVSMPPDPAAGGFACLEGNRHFSDGPRLLTIYRVTPGHDRLIVAEVPAEARPESGRLLWKAERSTVVPGRYYAEFEARIPLTPYGGNECPGFRSREAALPRATG